MYKNIKDLLDDVCKKYNSDIAFKLEKGKSYQDITYNKLKEDVYAACGYLQKIKCNRVALIGHNSYEWIVIYLATLCSGNIIVPLDNGLFEEEVLS